MYRFLIAGVVTFAALAAVATAVALGGDGPLPTELQDVRAAVAR